MPRGKKGAPSAVDAANSLDVCASSVAVDAIVLQLKANPEVVSGVRFLCDYACKNPGQLSRLVAWVQGGCLAEKQDKAEGEGNDKWGRDICKLSDIPKSHMIQSLQFMEPALRDSSLSAS